MEHLSDVQVNYLELLKNAKNEEGEVCTEGIFKAIQSHGLKVTMTEIEDLVESISIEKSRRVLTEMDIYANAHIF
jgi:hypothetical protein